MIGPPWKFLLIPCALLAAIAAACAAPAASRAAAVRLGFTFEGIFRQAIVYKGRNRDTAWFSIIDREWPAVRVGFERWLDPANFDAAGRQLRRLDDCLV